MATLSVVMLLATGCAASASTPAPRPNRPTTSTTVTATADPARLIATATGTRVDIYADPSTPKPKLALPNPWSLTGTVADPIVQVFRVQQRRADGWVQVLLPQRPNGQTGWIPPGEVTFTQTPYRIEVSLSAHQITVFDDLTVLYQGPVAIGAAATPTPIGSYSVRVLLRSSSPTSVYGPFAFGLSAHSDALTTFDGSDAEIGLHGNNDVSALGRAVSHGCIRMDNAAITRFSKILPLGTPVDIVQ